MSLRGGDEGARRLGEKLVREVEVEGLSEIFKALREMEDRKGRITENDTARTPRNIFGIKELDALIQNEEPSIVELVSPPPTHHFSGAGKTSLLYLLIAHAILPPTFSSNIPLPGLDTAIILFDPLSHFSVTRLTTILLATLKSASATANHSLPPAHDLTAIIHRSLQHVHIFRPSSWPSLLATLKTLPDTHLFSFAAHKSAHKRIHSLILDDADAFLPTIRSSTASSSSAAATSSSATSNLTNASTLLTHHLRNLTTLLSCTAILTSSSVSPGLFRPGLPLSWPVGSHVTRLAVRRVDVVPFAPQSSVEEAERERAQRWEVVARRRFECWKVGGSGGQEGGEGFVFWVGEAGVGVGVGVGEVL
ncbi:hypothetical protein ACN47E_001767 [Coniothyrium glycines]